MIGQLGASIEDGVGRRWDLEQEADVAFKVVENATAQHFRC